MAAPTDIHCVLKHSPKEPKKRIHIDALKPYYGPIPDAWVQYEAENSTAADDEISTNLHDNSTANMSNLDDIPTNLQELNQNLANLPDDNTTFISDSDEISLPTNLDEPEEFFL